MTIPPPDLILYHGDTSVCSIKVRLALAEKGLPWASRLVDLQRGDQHAPDYVKLNPAHVVPTLVDGDRVVVELSIILEYLEERFPTPSLMPAEPFARARLRLWLRKVDDLHASCSTISSAVKLAAMRETASAAKIETYLMSIHDAVKRARQRRLVEQGFDAPDVVNALQAFARFVWDLDAALNCGPFLMGSAFTLADVAAIPYVNRADMLGLDALWEATRPSLAAWLSRMHSRPGYDEAITRWAPEGSAPRYARSDALAQVLARIPTR